MLGVEVGRWRSKQLMGPSLGAIYRRMLEGSEEVVGVMDYHHWKLSPKLGSAAEVACHFAVSDDRLPNHTEGHRLNGRDALSKKAG